MSRFIVNLVYICGHVPSQRVILDAVVATANSASQKVLIDGCHHDWGQNAIFLVSDGRVEEFQLFCAH